MIRILCISLLSLSLVSLAHSDVVEDVAIEQAKVFFERFQSLQHTFDSSVAELYADEARIISTRKYPFGLPDRNIELSGAKYRKLIRKSIGLARVRGDISLYSEATYTKEGEFVRIHCMRFSKLKKYNSPYSLLVGPSKSGRWLIFEELIETRS